MQPNKPPQTNSTALKTSKSRMEFILHGATQFASTRAIRPKDCNGVNVPKCLPLIWGILHKLKPLFQGDFSIFSIFSTLPFMLYRF